MTPNMGALIAIVIVAAVVLLLAFWFIQKNRNRKELKERFGSEYDRTIETAGSRSDGEKQLAERQKRVEGFQLKELEPTQARRFADQWRSVQSRFVDDPGGATQEGDDLIRQVMSARGYPITNFDQQAADISVEHPEVVRNYRAAHAIAEANAREPASTEDRRQAMVHYRALFNDLLGASATGNREASAPQRGAA